jgi:hypothetical protein
MKTRIGCATAALIAGVIAMSACSGSGTESGTPGAAGARATGTGGATPEPQATVGAAGVGGSTRVLGHTTTTFTCDSFSATDMLTALLAFAPKTTAGVVKTERLADEFGASLVCDYMFASNLEPGLDPASAEGQDVDFRVSIKDASVDGVPTPQVVQQAFAKERELIKGGASGDATSDRQALFVAVTGIGDDAFFDDELTRQDGVNNSVISDLNVLRATLPMSVEVDLNYGVQPNSSVPAPPAASDPFQNDTRHAIVEAIATVIVTKLAAP